VEGTGDSKRRRGSRQRIVVKDVHQDHHPSGPCPSCPFRNQLGRRSFLGLLGAGLVAAVGGVELDEAHGVPANARTAASKTTSGVSTTLVPPTTTTAPVVELGTIPDPRPGPPQTVFKALSATDQIAITIDDGYCAPCASAYVEFAQSTGTHITFSPNGTYASVWGPLADQLKPLIAAGQVQIGNHTYSHANLLSLSNGAIAAELERNDEWVQNTFGITSRPWFRPPYGYRDARVDEVASALGYTRILMWSGTFGDSTPISPSDLLSLASQYLRPGVVMLGHANHTTVILLLPEICEMISERSLLPVTLDEMFGTSRNTG
jgi:peptidoglycan-N-acetylglucosamine deacetylase